ncbi:MAG: long-chain fatty acid--CoA ligase [Myxococcales bacterium]|nr:long-chain fatty acid--CoA ligase [Myxococcales bacterium]MBL0197926.1 long-chain fatty acid--CoA ligase [Myxococcales bacterium]HQY62297.1 long-chain fatty acid--CoA ligase [Polyangiaceae bacterium]
MAKFETLVDIFENSIRTYPNNDLFGTKKNGEWVWTTYLEFGKEVDACRAGLAALGVERGDRVTIVSNNRVEWAALAYACYGLGAAFVPMYEAQLAKEWEFIAKDCQAKVFVAATDAICEKAKGFLDSVPSITHIVSLDPATKAGAAGDKVVSYASLLKEKKTVRSVRPATTDVAGFIYTSGTTGNPKGVRLSHNNIASNISAVHDVFPMSASDRSLSFLPWAHVFGQTCELHALFSMGAGLALCESVEKIIDNLAETQPTVLMSVPRIFNRIYANVQKQISARPGFVQGLVKSALAARNKQRAGEELELGEGLVLALTDAVVFSKVRARFGGRLRYAFSGGAAISTDVAEFIDGLGITVYEGYGLTETSPIACANYPGARKIGSVGKPLPGIRIDVSPEGELIVHGPNVMLGYHDRDEENAAVFTEDGGFRTGDMGRVDDKGFVFITGRIKEQYKLENGKYVVPTPLEEQIKLSPYVANVMVYGDNKPYNVALVVANVASVRAWGAENGVTEASDEKLIAHEKVRALFKAELDKYAGKFKGFEDVKDYALTLEDFTTENGMLTPSLKLKRRAVLEKWKPTIEAIYAKKKSREGAAATA